MAAPLPATTGLTEETTPMCGIVGLFSKSEAVEERLGEHLGRMLMQMSDRGPDSAGVAIYRDPAPAGSSKLSLFSADPQEDWRALRDVLAMRFGGGGAEPEVRSSHAVLVVDTDAESAEDWLREHRPDLRIMSAGERIEIFKEMGSPTAFVERFRLDDISATH